MNFETFSALKGKHALFSASQNSWLRKDNNQIADYILADQAKRLGTKYHEYAEQAIILGRKQPKNHDTINMYINDAIGFKMEPEVTLYYSDLVYGTADSISFRNKKLRIHDLKTGVHPAKMDQLIIYASLFCLQYGKRLKFTPGDISIELRIYQNNEIIFYEPTVDEIAHTMDKIISIDKIAHDILAND